jgi:FixJ family two-component response regulator
MSLSSESQEVPTVFVVDPDAATGKKISEVLDGLKVASKAFQTARDFLLAYNEGQPGCLVLEQRIPDMSGFQLQHRLSASGGVLPLIFAIAKPEVSTAVELMRGGAVHVLEKPLRALELLKAIEEALLVDQKRRQAKSEDRRLEGMTATLSRKELEVLQLTAAGKSAKAIAAALELSVRAVEIRRKSLKEKLAVNTSAELMRFSIIANAKVDRQTRPSFTRIGWRRQVINGN